MSTIRETLSVAPHRETVPATPVTVFAARIAGWTIALGVAGIALWGLPYYAAPLARKVRVVIDWTIQLAFPRDIAQLGSLGTVRRESKGG